MITDILDDTIAVLNPQAEKRILVTAHLDEIGLVITTADENGYLYAIDRGGVIPQTYPGHRVQIHTEKGIVKGVVNGARELCRKEKLEVTDLAIDIGAGSKKEALELVRPGDTVTFDAGFEKLSGGRFAGRALDDRLGVFIIMEAFKRAKAAGAKNGLYCVATAGEETTKNGAYFTAGRVKPDLAIVVDVTYCTDYPFGYTEKDAGAVRLGAGPVLCHSPIVPESLNRRAQEDEYGGCRCKGERRQCSAGVLRTEHYPGRKESGCLKGEGLHRQEDYSGNPSGGSARRDRH